MDAKEAKSELNDNQPFNWKDWLWGFGVGIIIFIISWFAFTYLFWSIVSFLSEGAPSYNLPTYLILLKYLAPALTSLAILYFLYFKFRIKRHYFARGILAIFIIVLVFVAFIAFLLLTEPNPNPPNSPRIN